jgi:hypothetical protein
VAVEDGRDQFEVAAVHDVSWPTVQRAVVVHAVAELVEPEPTTVLGMDETRFGRPAGCPTVNMTTAGSAGGAPIRGRPGFADITGDQFLLGQVDGPTSAAVRAWLTARTAGSARASRWW